MSPPGSSYLSATVTAVLREQLIIAGADPALLDEIAPVGGGFIPYNCEDLVFAKIATFLEKGLVSADLVTSEEIAGFLILLELPVSETRQ